MSLKNILLGTLLGTALVACQDSDNKNKTKEKLTLDQNNVIIVLANETRSIITRVRVLRLNGVDGGGKLQYSEVANTRMQLMPKTTTIINTPTTACMLTVEVQYSDAAPEKIVQDYCDNMSLILKAKKPVIVSIASV